MYIESLKIRDIINAKLPKGSISPEHTPDMHRYRVHILPNSPLFDSVTTKTSILGKGYLKQWAVNLAVSHVRTNLTKLLDPDTREGVLYDASQQSEEVLEDAGGVGNKAHKIIESYIEEWISSGARPITITPFIPKQETDVRVVFAVRSVEKFFNEHYIIPIHSEMLVASPSMQVAGTMDFLCFIGTVIQRGNINCGHKFRQAYETTPYIQECIHCTEKVSYELGIIDWKTSNQISGHDDYALQISCYNGCIKEIIGLDISKLWVIRLDKKSIKYEKGIVESPLECLETYKNISKVYDSLLTTNNNLKVEDDKQVLIM